MKRVHKHKDFLKFISNCGPCQRKNAIKHASPDIVKTLTECVKNVLHGNVKLSDEHKKRLKKHRQTLRKISTAKTTSKRKKLLIQKGGFLPLLLAPLLSIVSSVAGATICRAIKK